MTRFALSSAVLLGFLSVAAAQSPTALSGRVLDPTGAAITDADVIVESNGTVVAESKTQRDGRFEFVVPEGIYEISAHAAGFLALAHTDLAFSGSEPTTITLRVPPPMSGFVVLEHREETQPEQSSPSQAVLENIPTRILDTQPWEYGAIVQGGVGLTQERSSFRFLMVGVHAGKVLTPSVGSGALRGNLEYAVEVFPFWQSYTPVTKRNKCVALSTTPGAIQCSAPFNIGGTFNGVSITPILLRWNFHGTRNVSFWAQGGGGVIWTNHKYPSFGGPAVAAGVISSGDTSAILLNNGPSADSSVWNFTPQMGVGAHWFIRPRRSIDFGANAVHISSASLGDRNPGVNATVQFTVGTTWWK